MSLTPLFEKVSKISKANVDVHLFGKKRKKSLLREIILGTTLTISVLTGGYMGFVNYDIYRTDKESEKVEAEAEEFNRNRVKDLEDTLHIKFENQPFLDTKFSDALEFLTEKKVNPNDYSFLECLAIE